MSKHSKRTVSPVKAYMRGVLSCIVLSSFLANVFMYDRIKAIGGIGKTYNMETAYTDDMRVSMNDLMERVDIDKKRK